MDPAVQQLLDIEEIKRLKADYFRLMDAKDWDAFSDVFTDDAEVVFARPEEQFFPPRATRMPDGSAMVGRDELLAWMREGPPGVTTVHHAHMPQITITGPDAATGFWSMTDYSGWATEDGAGSWLRAVGTHAETYARTAEGWRIRRSVFTRQDLYTIEGTRPSSAP